jgi:cytochrome b subunit of formate dehydrogenase
MLENTEGVLYCRFFPLEFSNMYLSCVLCTLCCQFLWIVFCFITPSVFSNKKGTIQRNWQHWVHKTQDK